MDSAPSAFFLACLFCFANSFPVIFFASCSSSLRLLPQWGIFWNSGSNTFCMPVVKLTIATFTLAGNVLKKLEMFTISLPINPFIIGRNTATIPKPTTPSTILPINKFVPLVAANCSPACASLFFSIFPSFASSLSFSPLDFLSSFFFSSAKSRLSTIAAAMFF